MVCQYKNVDCYKIYNITQPRSLVKWISSRSSKPRVGVRSSQDRPHKEYMNYWGYHLILDCSNCDKSLMTNYANVNNWIRQLVTDIDMSPVGDPRIEYTAGEFPDKAGFTVVQIIVTSSIVAHFVDNLGQIYLDVFSCKQFDPTVVKHSVSKYFNSTRQREYFLTRQAD